MRDYLTQPCPPRIPPFRYSCRGSSTPANSPIEPSSSPAQWPPKYRDKILLIQKKMITLEKAIKKCLDSRPLSQRQLDLTESAAHNVAEALLDFQNDIDKTNIKMDAKVQDIFSGYRDAFIGSLGWISGAALFGGPGSALVASLLSYASFTASTSIQILQTANEEIDLIEKQIQMEKLKSQLGSIIHETQSQDQLKALERYWA